MKSLIILSCFFILRANSQDPTANVTDNCTATSNLGQCPNNTREITWEIPCRNKCTGKLIVYNETHDPPCDEDLCCVGVNQTCVTKPPVVEEGRNFNLGFFPPGGLPTNPFSLPPNACPQSFPNNFQYNPFELQELQELVNIPYCQRIACSAANPFLDNNLQDCFNMPGCVYDQILGFYRNAFGHIVLPGVPVCHLAIRNQVFQQRAQEVADQFGSWNPYLTTCLLNQSADEIFDDAPGCQLLKLLTYFKHAPKLAGWRGITTRECALIGACWITSENYRRKPYCAYPVDINGQPTIRSSNNDDAIRSISVDLYGQPVCQNFNPSLTGAAYLKNYHICLSAGCAINYDPAYLLQQLIDAGSGLSTTYRFIWYRLVYSGQVQPYNYQSMLESLTNSASNPLLSLIPGFGSSRNVFSVFENLNPTSPNTDLNPRCPSVDPHPGYWPVADHPSQRQFQ